MDPLSSIPPTGSPTSANQLRKTTDTSPSPPLSETTLISPQAMEQLQEALSQIPDIRTDRIEKIRQALKDGTYAVSSEALADKLIQELSMPSHDSPLS